MVEAISGLIFSIIGKFGYLGISFLMFLESSLVPIPSEVVMPFSGFVSQMGQLNFYFALLAGILGQALGSVFIFKVGQNGGRKLLEKYGRYFFVREKEIVHADKLFEKYGEAIVFFGRLLPGVRTYISLPAGISDMNFSRFLLYSVLGIIPWTFFLLWLGVKMGQNWVAIKPYFHILDILIVVFAFVMLIWFLLSKNKKRVKASN